VVVRERFAEAVDLLFHVGVDEPLEIVDELIGSAVEFFVEALDGLLVEHVGLGPLTVGAAKGYFPAGLVCLAPVDRVREARVTGRTDVKLPRPGSLLQGAGVLGLLEVHDLDRLPARQVDALDVLVVFFSLFGFHGFVAADIGGPPRNL
jgi:hypothetical protein